MGFEPTEPFRVHSISNAANSTALAPFQTIVSIIEITNNYYSLFTFTEIMAERVGFEPTVPDLGTPIFETGALSHYATSPFFDFRFRIKFFNLEFEMWNLESSRLVFV